MPENLFPYPGNKARHSDWIVKHIPNHDCYVEPFGGAAGVLFNKPDSNIEVYNDLDGDVVQFFETLRDRRAELVGWLSRVPFSRELHNEWKEDFYSGYRPDDPIERAGRFFTLRYTQWGGKYHGTSGFSANTHRDEAGRFRKKTAALEGFADRLAGVTIECLPAHELVENYDGPDTFFYIDPPYGGSGGNYNTPDEFDHRRLYRTLEAIEGRCLVSYDTIPHWYGDGFQAVSKGSDFRVDTAGGNKEATEHLVMNYDADGEPLMSDAGQQALDVFTDPV